jgi:hypothetical protein
LWEFAARYAFPELEAYCLENKSIYEDLLKVLANAEQGLAHFARLGIPISKLNMLVTKVATAALQKSCFFCFNPAERVPVPQSPPSMTVLPARIPALNQFSQM